MSNLHPNDHVVWNSSGGKTQGSVTRKITNNTAVRDHKVVASPEQPQYEVISDKSGKRAIHKPSSLTKA